MTRSPEAHIGALLTGWADDLQAPPGSLERVRRRASQRRARTRGLQGAAALTMVAGTALIVRSPSADRSIRPADSAGPGLDTSAPVADSLQPTPMQLGSEGDDVRRAQKRLIELGFDPGPADGVFGTSTEQAIWAFEGLVLGRSYTQQRGVVDESVLALLDGEPSLVPRRPSAAGSTHVEIYLDLQVGIVFADNLPVLITHISSGQLDENGDPVEFCESGEFDTDELGQPQLSTQMIEVCGLSRTPGGVFEIYRKFTGDRTGTLGGMRNPLYFNYGIAIHGAVVVPREPASHGSVRVPMHIAEYLPGLVPEGATVYVWDGAKEPEEQTAEDMLPTFVYLPPDG